HSFFCVGDGKQAIYGWRGGLAELMDAVVAHVPKVTAGQLDCSYRSSQIVIDTVNTVFGTLEANPVLSSYHAVVTSWHQRFTRHPTARPGRLGHCRVVTAPAAHEEETQAVVTLQRAATEIARLTVSTPIRRWVFWSVAIARSPRSSRSCATCMVLQR